MEAKHSSILKLLQSIAIIVGLLAANIFQPGVGVDMSTLSKGNINQYVQTTEKVQHHGPMDIFVSIVPSNIVQSMVDGNILSIIFFSVLFGLGVAAIGEKGKPVLSFFEGTADVMFWVTNLIMKFAPFGVFALISVTVSKFGLESLAPTWQIDDTRLCNDRVSLYNCRAWRYCKAGWHQYLSSYQSIKG